MIKDIKIGKMLIQSENKAPRLHYCSLHNILSPNTPVILLDATLATGSTVKMAVRVLLDHGVKEENIYFLTIVSSPQVFFCFVLVFLFFLFSLFCFRGFTQSCKPIQSLKFSLQQWMRVWMIISTFLQVLI